MMVLLMNRAKKWCKLCGKYIGNLDYGQKTEHVCTKCQNECGKKDHHDQIIQFMGGASCVRCGRGWYDL